MCTRWNNTYIPGFNRSRSSTWNAYANFSAPGFADNGNTFEISNTRDQLSGTDTFKISDELSLENFALGTSDPGYYRGSMPVPNILGLGSNSSLLRDLGTKRAISSQSWSIWYGSSGAQASQQVNGNLVFGGYDKAKFAGANVTQSIQYTQSCPLGLMITITDITANFKNGSSPSILGSPYGSLQACLDLSMEINIFPPDVYYNLVNITRSMELASVNADSRSGRMEAL